jgi:uncharacterized membrane protein YfcA
MVSILNYIKSMTSGNSEVSTTRFVTLATTFTILIVYTVQNIVAMTKCEGYTDFPTNTVAVLFIVLGAKVGQHVSEQHGNGGGKQAPEPPKEEIQEKPVGQV